MRGIKFRVWSVKGKKMLDWDIIKDWGIRVLNDKNYIPLEYTGLKDKTGKEIYEGDIVKYANVHNIGEIKYSTSFCSFRLVGKKWGSPLSDEKEYVDKLEIIGNKYENPELLK